MDTKPDIKPPRAPKPPPPPTTMTTRRETRLRKVRLMYDYMLTSGDPDQKCAEMLAGCSKYFYEHGFNMLYDELLDVRASLIAEMKPKVEQYQKGGIMSPADREVAASCGLALYIPGVFEAPLPKVHKKYVLGEDGEFVVTETITSRHGFLMSHNEMVRVLAEVESQKRKRRQDPVYPHVRIKSEEDNADCPPGHQMFMHYRYDNGPVLVTKRITPEEPDIPLDNKPVDPASTHQYAAPHPDP